MRGLQVTGVTSVHNSWSEPVISFLPFVGPVVGCAVSREARLRVPPGAPELHAELPHPRTYLFQGSPHPETAPGGGY